MNRRSGAWLIVFFVLAGFVAQPALAADTAVLMIPRLGSSDLEMALTKEVGVMIKLLENNGYRVVVATVTGKPLVTKKMTLIPELKLADANPADYIGIIMPCMNAGPNSVEPEAVAFIKKAARLKLPIAAQRGSVLVLNQAGLRDWENDPQLKGDPLARYGGDGVFRNGNVITSGVCPFYEMETGKPDGTVKLTLAFIDCLREAPPEAPQ